MGNVHPVFISRDYCSGVILSGFTPDNTFPPDTALSVISILNLFSLLHV